MNKPYELDEPPTTTMRKAIKNMDKVAEVLRDKGVIDSSAVSELSRWNTSMRVKTTQTNQAIRKVNRRSR